MLKKKPNWENPTTIPMNRLVCCCKTPPSRCVVELWWAVCDGCNRPVEQNLAIETIAQNTFLEEIFPPTHADQTQIYTDRLAVQLRSGADKIDTIVTATELLCTISLHPTLYCLARSAFFVVMAIGHERFFDWIESRLDEIEKNPMCDNQTTGKTGTTELGQSIQSAIEIANAITIAGCLANSGSEFIPRGLSYAARALTQLDASPGLDNHLRPRSTVEAILSNNKPLSYYTFDPDHHGIADIFISALWYHQRGREHEALEMLHALVPDNGKCMPYCDTFYWGAFDLLTMISVHKIDPSLGSQVVPEPYVDSFAATPPKFHVSV